ncbi:MAG: DEAD/DEAH box helicase [Campylobacterales bacterium]|nr:DEAD/DEAH box helicase [Campylobacterales bacterium]
MTFHQLSLPNELVANLTQIGFNKLKPIQEKALPKVLQNQDCVIQAPTASGKTLVFAIASLMKLTHANGKPQILILAPTRELVEQIANEIRLVGRYIHNLNITTLVGGKPLNAQVQSLQNKTDIVVATVGRLIDHISRNTIAFDSIKMVVLDEADKMLEMGFRDEIGKITSLLPSKKQTLLFSATFPNNLNALIEEITHDKLIIKLDKNEQNIQSLAYECHDKDKMLLEILSHYQAKSTIIFANTKVEVDRLYHLLNQLHFSVLPFHGDFDQSRRDEIFIAFKNGSIAIIVATDIVSRGIDIEGVDTVIHYDIADKPQIHTHRVGRGGRKGEPTLSINLFRPNEIHKLHDTAGQVEQGIALDTPITPIQTSWKSIILDGGKRDKLRKGDILGALCQELTIDGKKIGEIEIRENRSYAAIDKNIAIKISKIKIKKRNFRLFLMT